MNVISKYKTKKWIDSTAVRPHCSFCRRPNAACYCEDLTPFESFPQFVILMHPQEARKKIATGRMTHRMLSNSFLFEGVDFSNHAGVNELIEDSRYESFVLYGGRLSKELAGQDLEQRPGKIPLYFIIDGTWKWAKSMYRQSENLHQLPAVRFAPATKSKFHVRRQPEDFCYSTIEAAHYILNHYHDSKHAPVHNRLLEVFCKMVHRQMSFGGQKTSGDYSAAKRYYSGSESGDSTRF